MASIFVVLIGVWGCLMFRMGNISRNATMLQTKNSAFARNQSKKKVNIFQSLLRWRDGISLWEGMSKFCKLPLQEQLPILNCPGLIPFYSPQALKD